MPDEVVVTEATLQGVRLFWATGQKTALAAARAVIDKVDAEMGPNVQVHSLSATIYEGSWLCEATVS